MRPVTRPSSTTRAVRPSIVGASSPSLVSSTSAARRARASASSTASLGTPCPSRRYGGPVGGRRAEPEPAGVHPLDVHRRERSSERAGDLERDRHAATGDPDDDRFVQSEAGGDGVRQRSARGLPIVEERRDPGDEPHLPLSPKS